jgi:hypothetical protein
MSYFFLYCPFSRSFSSLSPRSFVLSPFSVLLTSYVLPFVVGSLTSMSVLSFPLFFLLRLFLLVPLFFLLLCPSSFLCFSSCCRFFHLHVGSSTFMSVLSLPLFFLLSLFLLLPLLFLLPLFSSFLCSSCSPSSLCPSSTLCSSSFPHLFLLFPLFLPVHVHAACPCQCCMFMSMLHAQYMLLVHVHAPCSWLCCMSKSMLQVHVVRSSQCTG